MLMTEVNSVLVARLIAERHRPGMSSRKKRARPGEGVPPEVKQREGQALHLLWKKRATRTQQSFAEEHNATQGYLGFFFRGDRPLTADWAQWFAKELGVEVREFSPRLAAEIVRQQVQQEWPFKTISRDRFYSLSEGQRIALEGQILGEIVDIENTKRKK